MVIGSYVTVEDAEIGADSSIGDGATIKDGVVLDALTTVLPGATIYP